MTYAYPAITEFMQIFTWANTVTDGFFGIMLLMTFWMTIFISFKTLKHETTDSIAFSMLATAIFGMMLYGAGVMNSMGITMTIVLGVISLFLFIFRKGG